MLIATLRTAIQSSASRPSRRARTSLALLAVAAAAACTEQPDPVCVTTVAPFAFKLVATGAPVESTPGACTDFGPTNFYADPEVGVAPFFTRGSNGQPDYDHGSIAIQTAEIGLLSQTAEAYGVLNSAAEGAIFSRGDFTDGHVDSNNFCSVPTLTPTRLVLAAVDPIADDPATEDADESFPGQAAVDATLAWSNLRVYITPDIFGTQIDADLVDTRLTPAGDSCEYSYRAYGIAPAAYCGVTDDTGAQLFNDDGTPQVDPALCESEADPAAGRYTGSGLSPAAAFFCDPVSAYCLLEGEAVPALR